MRPRTILVSSLPFSILLCSTALGQVVFSVGSGASVAKPDRTATFDSISSVTPVDLASYTESGLSITGPGSRFNGSESFNGFDAFGDGMPSEGFHYVGGYRGFLTIRDLDAATLFGVELRIGDGVGGPVGGFEFGLGVLWETRLNGVVTGSGYRRIPFGERIGWRDNTSGFDELRLAGDSFFEPFNQLGDHHTTAIDDVFVSTSVPEPTSLPLAVFSFTAMALRRRRSKLNPKTVK